MSLRLWYLKGKYGHDRSYLHFAVLSSVEFVKQSTKSSLATLVARHFSLTLKSTANKDKYNLSSVSEADREISSRVYTDNAGNEAYRVFDIIH